MPISWHEECLFNSNLSIQKLKDELEKIKNQIAIMEDQNNFYLKQINTAKNKGVT